MNAFGANGPGAYTCNCGWGRCRGTVSLRTQYRHELRRMLVDDGKQQEPEPRPMSAESVLQEVEHLCA